MKNKKMMYVLLPAVLLVWGIIAFKFFQAIDNEAEDIPEKISRQNYKHNEEKGKDLFKLSLQYPDPFLNNPIVVESQPEYIFPMEPMPENKPFISAAPLPATTTIPTNTSPEINWPPVEYLGMIENRKMKKQIALVRIAGVEFFLNEKESGNAVKLERILTDSIQVSYMKQKKNLHKLL